MAVEWIESWGHFRDFQDLEARYTLDGVGALTGSNIEILPTGGPPTTPAGVQSPRSPVPGCLRFKGVLGNPGETKVKFPVTSLSEQIVGFAFLWEGVNANQTRNDDTILYTRDDPGNQPQMTLELNFGFSTNIDAGRGYIRIKTSTNGVIVFDSEDDADDAGDPDFHALQYNRWYWIEFRVLVSDTVGQVELRVDGERWILVTNIDTKPGSVSTIDEISFNSNPEEPITSGGHGAIYRISDVWVVSPAGGGNETGFLFPAVVDVLYPSAEVVGEIDFTPSTGTDNSALVDETQQNYDTDYNEANVATNKDRLDTSLSVPESSFGRVNAVQVNAMVKDTLDLGTRTFRTVIFENLTEGVGPTQTLTESEYQAIFGLFEDNPDTSAAWLMADVEAAEIGYEIIT